MREWSLEWICVHWLLHKIIGLLWGFCNHALSDTSRTVLGLPVVLNGQLRVAWLQLIRQLGLCSEVVELLIPT